LAAWRYCTTPKHQLIKAIATLTWPALVAPIIGPPLGGFITRYASWHWIFFINVPLGLPPSSCRCASSLIFAKRSGAFLRSQRLYHDLGGDGQPGDRDGAARRSPAADLADAGSAALGFGCLLYSIAISAGRWRDGASRCLQVPTFRVTMYGGSLFRLHQRGALSAAAAVSGGFGMDPFHSGLLVLAVFVGNLTIKPATTPLIRWLGFRRLLLINGALNVCRCWPALFYAADAGLG
jgi:hypothetical protein